MSDTQSPTVVDALDPLLPSYVEQYYLRERFLYALGLIQGLLDGPQEGIDAPTSVVEEIRLVVNAALDPEGIETWAKRGYPCPWLEDDPEAVEVTEVVLASLRRQRQQIGFAL